MVCQLDIMELGPQKELGTIDDRRRKGKTLLRECLLYKQGYREGSLKVSRQTDRLGGIRFEMIRSAVSS